MSSAMRIYRKACVSVELKYRVKGGHGRAIPMSYLVSRQIPSDMWSCSADATQDHADYHTT